MPVATVDGSDLHYLDVGAGDPPLVLLHAFPLHSEMWEDQMADLSLRRRVIAPDLAGFGKSTAPDDPSVYSMDRYADEVAGLLDALGTEQVILAGLSMGGYVAFRFLHRHRQRVAALVLADTRASPDTPEVAERRTRQQGQVRDGQQTEVVAALLGGLLTQHTRENRSDVVGRVRAMMLANPPVAFIGALEAMKNRPDSTDELDLIDVPTLVIVGEHDATSPPDVAQAMHERIRGSELQTLPGAAHLSNLEAPDAFTGALRSFLDRL